MKVSSRYIAILLGLVIVGAVAYYFRSLVAYILIAWVLSMIGQPFMDFFQQKVKIGKWRMRPTLSAVLTLIIYLLLVSLLLSLFVPLIVEQANNLASVDMASITTALEEPLVQLELWLEKYGIVTSQEDLEGQLRDSFANWFVPSRIGDIFSSVVAAAGGLLIDTFSIIFITFFFLKEQGLFPSIVTALVPNEYEQQTRNAIEEMSRMLTRYFGGIVIQISIITLIVTLGLRILGIENALLIGFFAGLINVIPYIGPIIGATFGIFITISANLDLNFYEEMAPLLLRVAIVFASMQLIDNFVLQPFIFSNSVLAHPLEIFLIILIGAQINGILGMVLAIPTYTAMRVIARAFLSEFKIVQRITKSMKQGG